MTSIAARIARSMTTATIRARTLAGARPSSAACHGMTLRGRIAPEPGSSGNADSDKSNSAERGVSDRARGTSGVARRTASGARGADGFVMSGRSSAGVPPNSGSLVKTGSGRGRRGLTMTPRRPRGPGRQADGDCRRRRCGSPAPVQLLPASARNRTHNSGSVRGRQNRGKRTSDTSWTGCAQRQQLPLNVGSEPIGFLALRIGHAHRLEDIQGVMQTAPFEKGPRPHQRGLAATRNRQGALSRRGRGERRQVRLTGVASIARQLSRLGSAKMAATAARTRTMADAAITHVRAVARRTTIPTFPVGAPLRGAGPCRSRRRGKLEAIQAVEQRQRLIVGPALVHRRFEQPPRFAALAAVKGGCAVVQQLFGLAQPLGQRAARPLDVGAGAGVIAIEKQRTRPDVDRLLVFGAEVMVRVRAAATARSSRRDPSPSRSRWRGRDRCGAGQT